MQHDLNLGPEGICASDEQLVSLLEREIARREAEEREHTKIAAYYPDAGPLRRDLYPKHLRFYSLGAEYRERMMMAGNRTGKTTVGCYETVLHATGRYEQYAPWWEGKRFNGPISAIVAGDTNLTTRDILQTKLFGKLTRQLGDTLNEAMGLGTGMMPKDAIIRPTPRRGAEDAYEQVTIKHISGGTSVIKLRSFEQGIEAFQGTEEDLIWLDENFPPGVYSESITRLATTNGHPLLTFTPIAGISPIIREFMDKAYRPGQSALGSHNSGTESGIFHYRDAAEMTGQMNAKAKPVKPAAKKDFDGRRRASRSPGDK